VLFRHGVCACAGQWTAATIWTKSAAWSEGPDLDTTWHSAEEATLEMPLQFEPEEFARLDDETLFDFIAT
jgi:hypothetical protein